MFLVFFLKLGNGSSGVQQAFLEWEKTKQQKLDEYHARKLEIYNTMINKQEEMIHCKEGQPLRWNL